MSEDITEQEKLTEGGLEEDVLRWLDDVGWERYGSGVEGEDNGCRLLDEEYDRDIHEVVYWDLLEEKLLELNDFLEKDDAAEAINSLKRDLKGENLIDRNREFYNVLRKGKKVTITQADGSTEQKWADLIDYENPGNNSLIVANQFRVKKADQVIPDVVLLVNGIPLVISELKSTTQDANWEDAYKDIKQYEHLVPDVFVPALFNIASDDQKLRVGAVDIDREYYAPWRKPEVERTNHEPRDAFESLLAPEVLLDILHNFVFFAAETGGDKKIIPRYMQYYASKKLMKRLKTGEADRGLYWHTQGSGKSYTMLFTAANLLGREGEQQILSTPQVIIIVDQDKLRQQMSNVLNAVGIEQHHVAKSINDLQRHIEAGKSEIILTTIQMFQDVDPASQGNENTVLMVDEAHRFMEKSLGSDLKAALPEAYHFAFTGTPVRESDRNTFREYTPDASDEFYHDRYSLKQGMEDEVILPVTFTLRHEQVWDWDPELLDKHFDREIGSLEEMAYEDRDELIRDLVTKSDLAELRPRVEAIVEEIHHHFADVQKNGWKGMVVTPSRKAAALYGEELMKFRDPEEIAVMISEDRDDEHHEPWMTKFHTTSEERDTIVENFKQETNPKLLVVCNMLLTGFDAPVLKTMYLDRYLTNHTLLQAIARTNRPAEGKVNGEIVDFQGVFQELDKALDYDLEVRENAAIDREQLLANFFEKLEALLEIFEGIEKRNSSETLNECLTRLTKRPDLRKQFEQCYRSLRDLYESLSPDERLAEDDVERKYSWLNQVWVAYQRQYYRNENADRELKEKTKEILEENISIEEINRDYPVIEVSQKHLDRIRNLDPATKATEIAHAVTEHLRDKKQKNPRYEQLHERVQDLLQKWEAGEVEDMFTADQLVDVEEEILEVEQEPEQREMTEGEYAITKLLTEEYESHIEAEAQAEEFARTIGAAFREKVDTGYEGWKENPETRNKTQQVVIETIVKELDRPGLYHADKFVDQATDYLIENVDWA